MATQDIDWVTTQSRNESDWMKEGRAIQIVAEEALRSAIKLHDHMGSDDEAKAELESLNQQLKDIRTLADMLKDRYLSAPFAKIQVGQQLTREEFYVCRAMGMPFGTACQVGLLEFDDYEIFRMLCYEDDIRYTYINVDLQPVHYTRMVLRFGRAPEKCQRRFLSPAQHDFFREHLPDVYDRFGDD